MRGNSVGRPNLRLRSTDVGPVSEIDAIRRGVMLIAVVTQPIIAMSVIVITLILGRTRAKGWVVTLVGVSAMVWVMSMGWGTRYTAPYWGLIKSIPNGWDAVQVTLQAHWMEWLLGQLPFGISTGAITAGLMLWWRSRYRAIWREKIPAPLSSRGIERKKTKQTTVVSKAKAVTDIAHLNIPLGIDDYGNPVNIPATALRMHAVVAGPTGFGKTQSLLRLMHGLVVAPSASSLRLPCVMIDMKGDDDVVRAMRQFAALAGRRLWLIQNDTYPDTDTYNVLSNSTPDQTRAKLIEAEANAEDGGFTEPHYRRLGERFLLIAARAHADLVTQGRTCPGENRPWQPDLGDLVKLLDLHQLSKHLNEYSPDVARDVTRYVNEAELARIGGDLYGIRTRYALLVESAAGRVLRYSPDGLVLYDAIINGDFVLFSLDAGTDPATSRALGNLALQDLIFTFAALQSEGWGKSMMCPIFLDEFSALGGSIVANLYARVRAAGGAVILATQDLDADLAAVSEQFASAVLTNANVMVLHRQKGTAASARAEAIGTKQTWSETLQITDDWDILGGQQKASGVGSLREVDKFLIHPNEFKSLPQGVAYVLIEHPHKLITRCHINRLSFDEPTKKKDYSVSFPNMNVSSWAEAITNPGCIDVPNADNCTDDDDQFPLTEPDDYEEW